MEKDNLLKLYFSYKDERWIPAGDCGLGLQDLLVILYFSLEPGSEVVLIEEPESHLHPDFQRRLLQFLKYRSRKQYFLTTHSNVFLNNSFVDQAIFTTFDKSVKVNNATARASILDDLGYSVADNLISDLVILVEGPKDIPLIEVFLLKKNLLGQFDIKYGQWVVTL